MFCHSLDRSAESLFNQTLFVSTCKNRVSFAIFLCQIDMRIHQGRPLLFRQTKPSQQFTIACIRCSKLKLVEKKACSKVDIPVRRPQSLNGLLPAHPHAYKSVYRLLRER